MINTCSLLDLAEVVSSPEHPRALALREETADDGIVWDATIAHLVERFGVDRWFDFSDVVRFAGLSVLGLPPADWFHLMPPDRSGLATDFFCDFWLSADVRDNHLAVTDLLTARLGSSEPAGTSNTLGDRWTVGWFDVRCVSFPDDLQNVAFLNPLNERHPELDLRTTVNVSARIGSTTLDDRLAGLIADASARLPIPVVHAARAEPAMTRLHPPTDVDGLLCWRSGQDIGLSTAVVSMAMSVTTDPTVQHLAQTPAKGSGVAEVRIVPAPADGRRRDLLVASSSDHTELGDLAAELAARLELRLDRVVTTDV